MLPKFFTTDPSLSLLQTRWASLIDPLLSSPIATPVILSSVTLSNGVNTLNHTLGRKLVGWHVVRARGAALIHDDQDNNLIPDKTLRLVSSSGVSIDLLVF